MRGKTLILLISIVLLLQSIAVGWGFRQVAQSRNAGRHATCVGISKLDNTLINLIRNGEKTLPTLEYYKTHPDDLVKALSSDEQAITALTPPKYC